MTGEHKSEVRAMQKLVIGKTNIFCKGSHILHTNDLFP